MKTNYLLLLLTLTIIGCNDNDSETLTNGDEFTYSYVENSNLVIKESSDSYIKTGSIEAGDNLVFKYQFNQAEKEEIADDEYSETIRFEIDSSLESFSYKDEDLVNIDLVFTKACYCYFPFEESKDVAPTGTIRGEKVASNKWEINIDLIFYGDEARVVEETFVLE